MPIVYHGTSDIFLERIKKGGLCAAGTSGNIQTYAEDPKLYRKDGLYTSPLQVQAWSIAEQTTYSLGGKPVVIGFSTNRFTDRGLNCKIQKREAEHNFIRCKCVPRKILLIQTVRPKEDEIVRGERFKVPVGEWDKL